MKSSDQRQESKNLGNISGSQTLSCFKWGQKFTTFTIQITIHWSFLLFNCSLCLQNPGLLISRFLLSCFSFKVPGDRLAQKRLPPSKGQQVRTPCGSPSRADMFPVTWSGYICSGKLLQAASRGSPTLRSTTAAQPVLVPNRLQPPTIGTLQLSLSPTRYYFFIIKGSLLPLLVFFFWLFFHDEQIWLRENITVSLRMRSINVLIIMWKSWTFIRYF